MLLRHRTTAVGRDDMRQQEIGNALVGVDLIFHAREPVAFIFVNLGVDGAPALLDGVHDLLRF